MNWNAAYANNRDYSWLTTQNLSLLLSEVGMPDEHNQALHSLDIGCGTGQIVRDLCHRGFSAYGIDTSTEAISVAQQSTVFTDTVRFEVKNIETDTFEETFDLITCKYVIAFIDSLDSFIAKAEKLLNRENNKATFVIITPDPSMLPPNKQSIGADTEKLEVAINAHFRSYRRITLNNDFWYFCS